MKSLTELWKAIAEDYSAICDTPIDRDLKTVLDRVECEGMSFLTITLPTFCSDFERCLDERKVGSDLFCGFKKRKGLPKFLSGFLLRVFDGQTCELLESPDIFAIQAIRQLTLSFKKVEIECTEERNEKALEKFVLCEEELKEVDKNLSFEDREIFKKTVIALFGSVFNDVNRKVDDFELVPAHGPGATADRKTGNQKFVQSEWTDRLEEYFPYGEYAIHNWRYFKFARPKFLPPEQERPVKITLVPKTLKTPRVIAVEPSYMQYMQKALMRELVEGIESDPLTSPMSHFTDQTLNQGAARQASVDNLHATLDLSEASDRVLNSLVIDMLSPWPALAGAVQACRSQRAKLIDGTEIPLTKFASMGSALTFPMEVIAFTAMIAIGIAKQQGVAPWSTSFLKSLHGDVHVYGDDMIVPIESVQDVIRTLGTYGLKVNHSKSFWSGSFRESCGGDFYDGKRVNATRLSQLPPKTSRDVSEVLAWNAFMNSCYDRGLMKAGKYTQRTIEKALKGRLPNIPPHSGGIGVHTDPRLIVADRMSKRLHVPLVHTWIPQYHQKRITLDDFWGLRKTLTGDWSDPVDRKHLTHSGRPLASRMKRAWVPAV